MRFSIIIPTYNYGKFIKKAVESILLQKGGFSYEILIIDDASTDNTKEIVKQLLKENENIKYFVNKKNEGTAFCYRKGILASKGEIICILDADDLWKSNKLVEINNFFEKKEDVSLLFHNADKIDSKGNLISSNIFNKPSNECIYSPIEVLKKDFFGPLGSTLCFNSNFIKKIKIPKEVYAAVDGYLLLATILRRGKVYYLDKSLSFYRFHQNSTTYSANIKKLISNLNNYSIMLSKCYNLCRKNKDFSYIYFLSKLSYLRAKILEGKKVNKIYFEKLLITLFDIIGLKKFVFYTLLNLNKDFYLFLRKYFYRYFYK